MVSPGGDSRERRVPLISGRNRTIPASCSPCARPVPRRTLVHSRPHPGTTRDTTPRPPAASPNVRTGPVPSPLHPPAPGRSPNRSPPGAPRQTVRRSSPSPHRVGRPPRALPAIRSRRPGPSQPGARTVRRSLRHRPDTANTTKSWTPSSHGENRSWPTTPPDDGYPTDPSKGSTTSYKSYDASPTGSPTTTTTPPEESS